MSTALLILAVARLARLITADRVTQGLRDRVGGVTRDEYDNPSDPKRPVAAYFIQCPWCTSIYLGVPLVAAWLIWPGHDLVLGILLVLAASWVAGFLATVEGMIDAATDRLDTIDDDD